MNIHIILIAYALDVKPLITSLIGDDTYFHLYTHSRLPVTRELMEWSYHTDMYVHDYGSNRGLSTSWNDGIIEAQKEGAEAILIINDDVIMNREDMLKMAQGCVDHRECGIIEISGFNERMNETQKLGYACFGINPIAIETVGYFDQNLVPYCFEDCDYSRRCYLAGIPFGYAGPSNAIHKGSATIHSDTQLYQQNSLTFSASSAYYQKKWGGQPGHETYKTPFNVGFGLKIEAEYRIAPYPGFNRTDLDIIKV